MLATWSLLTSGVASATEPVNALPAAVTTVSSHGATVGAPPIMVLPIKLPQLGIARCFGATHSRRYCHARTLRQRIKRLRQIAWNRFAEHGTLSIRQERTHGNLSQLRAEHTYWVRKLGQARRLPSGPQRFTRWNQWMCIHSHEGSWTDPNWQYYGGLQMDMQFQRDYGPEYLRQWGTANHWPPYVQVLVAERAYKTRGYGPWPKTVRMCGLR